MEQLLTTIVAVLAFQPLLFLFKQNKKQKLSLRTWFFGLSAVVLVPFGIGWGITSVFEHEMQAAFVGIALFSGLGCVFGFLAWKDMFPGEEREKREPAAASQSIAKVTVASLIILAAILLPAGMTANKISSTLTDTEALNQTMFEGLIADEAMPAFIKKAIYYETLYGVFPEKTEERIMQAVFYGVKDEEMMKLLNMIVPENERKAMTTQFISAAEDMLTGQADYLDIEIAPQQYLARVSENTETIARWIYKNFSLPPMEQENIDKFRRGEFGDSIETYIGKPPEDIKESLIVPFAKAIKAKLATVEVPAKVSTAKVMSEKVSKSELTQKISRLQGMNTFLKSLWIIALVLIVAVFALVYFAKLPLLLWSGISLCSIGLVGACIASFISDSHGLTERLIEGLTETAPPPGLAVINQLLPDLLHPFGFSMMVSMIVVAVVGGGLVYWAARGQRKVAAA